MKLHLSASSLSRTEKCPASASLPRVRQLHADAAAGTAAHAKLEQSAAPGEFAEVAYAYSVLTGKGRLLGFGLNRGYVDLAEGEIPGTADLVRVEAERVVVVDYKTGFGYMVTPARNNLQLLHNALAAASVAGRTSALVQINRTAIERIEEAELDAFDLAAGRARLRAIYDAANTEKPTVATGDHCWRCECVSNCPAHLTMAIAFTEGLWPDVLPTDGLTIEKVATGWEYLRNAKRVLGLVEQTFRAFASLQPVPLSNGNVLGAVQTERESLDGAVTRQVLRDLHSQAVADDATEMSVTKASVERALAKVAPPRGKAKLVREALDAVSAANGIVVSRGVRIEEHKPGSDAQKAE